MLLTLDCALLDWGTEARDELDPGGLPHKIHGKSGRRVQTGWPIRAQNSLPPSLVQESGLQVLGVDAVLPPELAEDVVHTEQSLLLQPFTGPPQKLPMQQKPPDCVLDDEEDEELEEEELLLESDASLLEDADVPDEADELLPDETDDALFEEDDEED